tara:strand:- start:244 stop:465 length:222 start_codon:yes stop_codon:yes gene_type:complete
MRFLKVTLLIGVIGFIPHTVNTLIITTTPGDEGLFCDSAIYYGNIAGDVSLPLLIIGLANLYKNQTVKLKDKQ